MKKKTLLLILAVASVMAIGVLVQVLEIQ